jgi:hypothetical protein
MTIESRQISPQVYARLGGALYVAIIVLGAFAEGYAMNRLIAPGDAATTARNIMAAPGLWRLAVACDLIVPVLAVTTVWVSYVLLRPVSKYLVLLDVFYALVSIAIEAVSKLFLLMVEPTLAGAGHPGAFDAPQLQVLASLALRSHDITFNIELIFFACSCLVEGYLIFKSGYFPKFLGVLLQLAGASYLVSCFAALFAPAFAELITPAGLIPALIGESAYALWLLIKGVELAKWNERVGTAAAG